MGIVAFFMAMSNSPSYWPLPCGDALASPWEPKVAL